MAGLISWASGSVITGLGLQLSGQGAQISNGVTVMTSGILDNTGVSGGPAFFAFAELLTSQSGFGAATAALTTIDFYLVPSRDGTNYMDLGLSGGTPSPNHYKGSFFVSRSGNAQMRLGIDGIALLPLKYTGVLKNNTGQTLTSGWSVQLDTYFEAYT